MWLVNKWYLSLERSSIDFLINILIVKVNSGRVIASVSIDNTFGTGPINSSQAHGARFATCIYFTAFQLKGIQFFTSLTDSDNLRMRRRIVGCCHHIIAFAYNFTVQYYYTSKRTTIVLLHSLPR